LDRTALDFEHSDLPGYSIIQQLIPGLAVYAMVRGLPPFANPVMSLTAGTPKSQNDTRLSAKF
jgi:hypothetical protein